MGEETHSPAREVPLGGSGGRWFYLQPDGTVHLSEDPPRPWERPLRVALPEALWDEYVVGERPLREAVAAAQAREG